MVREAHPKEALQDLAGGRLDPVERARVEEHLAGCDACRREVDTLRWTVERARGAFASEKLPAGLEVRLRRALDAEDAARSRPTGGAVGLGGRRAWVWLAVAATAVLAVASWFLARPGDLPASIARDYEAYEAGRLALELRTADHQVLERFFAQRGVSFPTRVLDLSMVGYGLLGGRLHTLQGRPSALFVYQGPRGQVALCQMFEGSVAALPRGAMVREQGGIIMYAYQRKGTSLALWQEGRVLCVLVSDLPVEELLSLAFHKAMKV